MAQCRPVVVYLINGASSAGGGGGGGDGDGGGGWSLGVDNKLLAAPAAVCRVPRWSGIRSLSAPRPDSALHAGRGHTARQEGVRGRRCKPGGGMGRHWTTGGGGRTGGDRHRIDGTAPRSRQSARAAESGGDERVRN